MMATSKTKAEKLEVLAEQYALVRLQSDWELAFSDVKYIRGNRRGAGYWRMRIEYAVPSGRYDDFSGEAILRRVPEKPQRLGANYAKALAWFAERGITFEAVL